MSTERRRGPLLLGIFGAGRSGSTLLMRLMDGSPDLWVHPVEINYFSAVGLQSWRKKVKKQAYRLVSTVFGQRSLTQNLFSRQYLHKWVNAQINELNNSYVKHLNDAIHIHEDSIKQFYEREDYPLQEGLIGFLETVQQAYDDRPLQTRPILAFKSIEVANLQQYQELFPEMRFLHIIRHPFSNYASLKRTDMVNKKKPFWFQGGDILRMQLEKRWIPHAQFLLKARRTDPERHYLVRYEDLCADPASVVAGICQWLGVPTPEDPFLQTVLGGRRMKELPINSSKDGVKTPERVVANMAEEFGYNDVLTDRERELILFRTHELGRQLGYFGSGEVVGLPGKLELLKKWVLPDKWEFMNARPRLRLAHALLSRRLYICSKLFLSSSKM